MHHISAVLTIVSSPGGERWEGRGEQLIVTLVPRTLSESVLQ